MKNPKIVWQIDLSGLIDKRVSVETREGHIRNAKLTEVRFGSTNLAGHTVEYPTSIVLDGDDEIPFAQIRQLNVA